MKISAHSDIDVVAIEQTDEVHVLLELTAPELPESGTERPEHTAVVVLDRSGSMNGGRLASAKRALVDLVGRLDDRDRFGLVTFDDQAEVVVPAGRVGDLGKGEIIARIRAVRTGGMTDLSAGYLRGLQEARRVATRTGATIVLVSDGHANSGIVDPVALGQIAGRAGAQAISTSTVGIGTGYDDRILDAVAREGQGNHSFAVDGDGAAAAIGKEIEGLLTKSIQAASVLVVPTGDVKDVTVLNDLPAQPVEGGVLVELGDLYAGETRRLSLRLGIPLMAGLGLAQVAELKVSYVTLADLVQHTVDVPVQVNVVPADVAAGRVRDAKVVEEALFATVQRAKKASADAVSSGDLEAAKDHLRQGISQADQLPGSATLHREKLDLQGSLEELEDSERHSADFLSGYTKSQRSRARNWSKGSTADVYGGVFGDGSHDGSTDGPRSSGGAA